jgi:predicted Zn-dependent protease
VLDTPDVNAFALPGGYVYFTRGIMAYLESEAELAGVIGHEIGHVTARHGAQRATRQQKAGIGVLAATVLGAVLETAGVRGATDLFSQASQNAAAGYIASYSREQESQADQLGAEYLVRNRYNPQNMVDVIGVLKSQERFAADQAQAEGRAAPAGANWLSSHPSNDQRLADIRRIAAGYAAPAGGYGDEGRTRYLQALEGVSYGDSRAQGVTRGRNFYHEDLGIALTAPNGWRVQNRPDAIVLVNGAGDAGLVVRLVPPKAGATHEEILRGLGQPVSGRPEPRTLNGLAATRFAGSVRNAQGQTQAVDLTLVTGPASRTYLLLPVSRDAAALQRAQTGLAQAEGSFRALTAADRAAARPWAIRLQPLPRGGFAELARGSPLGERAEGQLRLLNGVYTSNGTAPASAPEPRPGQLVKSIQP